MEHKKEIGKYISNLELGKLLSNKTTSPMVQVVDCRDSDFLGGHIIGCQNLAINDLYSNNFNN